MTTEQIRALNEIRCTLMNQVRLIDALLIAPKKVYCGPWKNPNGHITPDEAAALYYSISQPLHLVPAWEWSDTLEVWALADP